MKQKENNTVDNIMELHVALTNNSAYTSDAIRVALSRMDENKTGVRVIEIEEQPFVRHLVNYLYQFKIDLLLIDMQLEGQNTALYLEKIKNIDKEIKIVLLSQFVTPEVLRLQNMKIIDEYISLPFQDANLWDAIYRIYNPSEIDHIEIPIREVDSIPRKNNAIPTQGGHRPMSVFERNKNKPVVPPIIPLKREILFEFEEGEDEEDNLLINLNDTSDEIDDSTEITTLEEESSLSDKLNIEEEENIIFEDMWSSDEETEEEREEDNDEDERLNEEIDEIEEDFRMLDEDEIFEL